MANAPDFDGQAGSLLHALASAYSPTFLVVGIVTDFTKPFFCHFQSFYARK